MAAWAKRGLRTASPVEVWTALYGKDDWRVTNARISLADVDLIEKMTPADRADFQKASNRNTRGTPVTRSGPVRGRRATVGRAAAATRLRLLGDAHPSTLITLRNLAALYRASRAAGRRRRARGQGALAGSRKVLGDVHPNTLFDLHSLHQTVRGQSTSTPKRRRGWARGARRQPQGSSATPTRIPCLSLSTPANVYSQQARYADAEPLMKEALAGCARSHGPLNPKSSVRNQQSGRTIPQLERVRRNPNDSTRRLAGCRKAYGDAHQHTLPASAGWPNSTSYKRWYADARAAVEGRPGRHPDLGSTDYRRRAVPKGTKLGSSARTLRYQLDLFLTFGVEAHTPPADRYAEVLAWEGGRVRPPPSSAQAVVERSNDPELEEAVRRSRGCRPTTRQPDLHRPTQGRESRRTRSTSRSCPSRKDDPGPTVARKMSRSARPERPPPSLRTDSRSARTGRRGPGGLPGVPALPSAGPKGLARAARAAVALLAFIVRNGQPVVEIELGPVQPITEAVEQVAGHHRPRQTGPR